MSPLFPSTPLYSPFSLLCLHYHVTKLSYHLFLTSAGIVDGAATNSRKTLLNVDMCHFMWGWANIIQAASFQHLSNCNLCVKTWSKDWPMSLSGGTLAWHVQALSPEPHHCSDIRDGGTRRKGGRKWSRVEVEEESIKCVPDFLQVSCCVMLRAHNYSL